MTMIRSSLYWLITVFCLISMSEACSDSSSGGNDPTVPQATSAPWCGTEREPCELPCGLACSDQVADAALECVMTLEGKFDDGRKLCTFSDGGEVVFEQPVPLTGETELLRRPWSFVIRKKQELCLGFSSRLLPADFGNIDIMNVAADSQLGSYRQEPIGYNQDGGGNTMNDAGRKRSQIRIQCMNGKNYISRENQVCAGCDGSSCRGFSTLKLEVKYSGNAAAFGNAFEFALASGNRTTPLFTCR